MDQPSPSTLRVRTLRMTPTAKVKWIEKHITSKVTTALLLLENDNA